MSFINFPTPTPVFPILSVQGFPVVKRPIFSSWEHRAVDGGQFQTARQVYPNWDFELQYSEDAWLREQTQNIATYTENAPHKEFQQLSQLFLACLGSYGEFYYLDPEDSSRAAQAIGIGDGTATVFRIVRTWGSLATARVEPVGGVDLGATIAVYLNGSPLGSGYTVTNDLSGSHITFDSAPAVSVAITMDFTFYYRCRWLEDSQQYDQFMYNLFQLGKAKFRSVKP